MTDTPTIEQAVARAYRKHVESIVDALFDLDDDMLRRVVDSYRSKRELLGYKSPLVFDEADQ